MLSAEDNDLLNRVEPGWPLNTYFKHFWLPVMTSRHLERDGMPEKVKLLGENYVLFRDSDGKVGCLDEACPHRGISLSLGRNENNALTCIFHGWSFNAKGECVATPTEPNKDFCKKVRVKSYPTREAGGAIWVYLAPGEPARFPDFPFNYLSDEQTHARRGITYSNWSQNIEAQLDIGHLTVLHQNSAFTADSLKRIAGEDQYPNYKIEAQDYGLRTFSTRSGDAGKINVRIDEYIAPNAQMIASGENEVAFMSLFVPVDDATTQFWVFLWGKPEQIGKGGGGLTKVVYDDRDWQATLVDRSKVNFGQDREAMKKGHWSGVPTLASEDLICCESIPIIDRTKEQLCSSDVVIIRHRRDLLLHLRSIRAGTWQGPPDTSKVNYRTIRALALELPAGSDPIAIAREKEAARRAGLREAAE